LISHHDHRGSKHGVKNSQNSKTLHQENADISTSAKKEYLENIGSTIFSGNWITGFRGEFMEINSNRRFPES